MKADIIIPCYNQLEYTKRCLWALAAHTDELCEWFIIDNGSTDGTAEYLSEFEDEDIGIHIITNDANLGFARAVNMGILAGDSPYVVLLNNDTEVPQGWLTVLIEAMEADPRIGAMGVLSTAKMQETWEGRFNPRGVRVFAQYRLGQLPYSCVILRREAIDDVGLLDEGFFLYGEDDDYNIRLIRAGWSLALHTDITVKHEHGATSTPAGLQHYRKAAMERIREKWGGPERIDANDEPDSRRSKAHRRRYEYAASLLNSGDTVLDAACGMGYGSAIMAKACQSVLGLDYNREALITADAEYGGKRVTFERMDLEKAVSLPRRDVVVSFETIEHLAYPRDFAELCKAAARRLIVLSLPYQDVGSGWHKHPFFTEQQIRELFEDEDWEMVEAFRQAEGPYGVYRFERR